MKLQLRNILLLLLMLAAAGLAIAMRPTNKIADQGPEIDLETMIPRTFGDWREEKRPSAQIIDQQQKESIEAIYSQTLSREYVNVKGYRIMLSLAYGSEQSSSLKVHLPEVCYPAQGFNVESKQGGSLAVKNGEIPVTRILTTMGQRIEPVTYWTTIAHHVVQSRFNRKLIEISYGLTGKIPDGMLIRVSSIDADSSEAFKIQDSFATQMLEALAPEHRQRLAGNL